MRLARERVRSLTVDAGCVLVLAACAVFLHSSGLAGGPAYYERDTQVFYYPLAKWIAEQFHAGVYPLWLPTIFTGYPVLADGEMGLLYLPQVLFLWLLPTALAMVWLRTLHVFLAGLFMHLFLRVLRLAPLPALGGALVFAFGSFLTAQMHHENVVRSSVWLPLVLLLVEKAIRAPELRRRLAWLALAAMAYAQAALGLHVQPVLMEALALGAYVVFRLACGPYSTWVTGARRWWLTPRHSVSLGVLVLAAVGGGGIALAAAQWLPLGEWALVSSRRGGVDYVFASAFGLAPENIPTLLFPYFFRLQDNQTWWTLWQPWETELYVGLPTLALSLVGVVFSRRREIFFFLPLGVLALLLAMASYSPWVNLHQILWSLPGFSFLRAPGRFTYLVVFSFAGLAALGLQALAERQRLVPKLGVVLVGAVPCIALLAACLALFPAWQGWLAADPSRALNTVVATYVSTRSQFGVDPGAVYQGLLWGLDLSNPKTLWSLVLLGLTALGFVVWFALDRRWAWLAQALFVSLIAVDLLVFARDFHPLADLASLEPAPLAGVPAQARVFLSGWGPGSLFEPDQLTADDTATVQGYSSLPSERHVELETATNDDPTLLDVWSAPYLVVPSHPDDGHTASGVVFRSDHPLAEGFQGSPPVTFVAPPGVGSVTDVRLVGTLNYAFLVPQDTPVATLTVTDSQGSQTTLPVRAGDELAERAIDRPSIARQALHHKPPGPTALDTPDSTDGEDYLSHLYLADLPLSNAPRVASLTITDLDPHAQVVINGLALVLSSGGSPVSLGLGNLAGFQVASTTEDYQVIKDGNALPRVTLWSRASAVPAPSGQTPIQSVASADFDPQHMLLIEGAPNGELPSGTPSSTSGPLSPAPTVQDLGPNALRITVDASEPSYLVVDDFYQRGWTATVDGHTAPVRIANAVFQAVPLDPGQHVVDVSYRPISLEIGAVVSVLAWLVGLSVCVWGFGHRPRPLRMRGRR